MGRYHNMLNNRRIGPWRGSRDLASGHYQHASLDSHGILSRGFRRSCLEWQWQSPSDNGVCSWGLRVSSTPFRPTSALLLQYFESAVPTDHRADMFRQGMLC